jgi:hypothetical protein
MSDHPILKRLTSLKPLAGMAPREPALADGVQYAPASAAENEAAHLRDLDAELERDAKLKGLMPVIEANEEEAKRRRTGYLKDLAMSEPMRQHTEAVIDTSKRTVLKAVQVSLSLNPSLKKLQVTSGDVITAALSQVEGGQVVVTVDW